MSGGHSVYKLARLLDLNEAETTDFDGNPDEASRNPYGRRNQTIICMKPDCTIRNGVQLCFG